MENQVTEKHEARLVLILDRTKILDEAIFMAHCARKIILEEGGVRAEKRLSLAIEGLNKVYKDIEDVTDRHLFPSTEYLQSKDYI